MASAPRLSDTEDENRPESVPYPPGPTSPPDLNLVATAYRVRVVLVLASLFLFLAFYLGLIVGAGYLAIACLRTLNGWLALLAFAGSTMLFLFLLKGLFKRRAAATDDMVEVREEEQPDLFAFIRRLCAESGSSFPGKIFISHDVNAGVFYPRSLLSLVWPVRKNLVIGLGLVNALGLSEFKAVLAHEFGHFAQSSMKLGHYVYVANQVIADLVFERDGWDRALAHWRRIDLRLSIPAWVLTGVVWVLRKALELVFRGLNFLNLSLSRQMEFNADLCAVRLVGSDALISGLWKTERAAIAYQLAAADLASIAQHGKFTDDILYHHTKALRRVDKVLGRDPSMRERFSVLLTPYAPGEQVHFQEAGERAASMWATHPSNRDRELNAKKVYIPAPLDHRPAWMLLRKPKRLRKALTFAAYEAMGRRPTKAEVQPAAQVHGLITEERAEMEQAAHYHGLYDDRIIKPGDTQKLAAEIDRTHEEGTLDRDALRVEARRFTGAWLEELMKRRSRIGEEAALLSALNTGRLKLKKRTFTFRGRERRPSEVPALLTAVESEFETTSSDLARADQAFFRYFYAKSGEDAERRTELRDRYEFLLDMQEVVIALNRTESALQPVLETLTSGRELSQAEVRSIGEWFERAWGELVRSVQRCSELPLPKLLHLEDAATARDFVLAGSVVAAPGATLTPGWINELLRQLGQAAARARKLHFKNLGALLALQESLDPTLFTD